MRNLYGLESGLTQRGGSEMMGYVTLKTDLSKIDDNDELEF